MFNQAHLIITTQPRITDKAKTKPASLFGPRDPLFGLAVPSIRVLCPAAEFGVTFAEARLAILANRLPGVVKGKTTLRIWSMFFFGAFCHGFNATWKLQYRLLPVIFDFRPSPQLPSGTNYQTKAGVVVDCLNFLHNFGCVRIHHCASQNCKVGTSKETRQPDRDSLNHARTDGGLGCLFVMMMKFASLKCCPHAVASIEKKKKKKSRGSLQLGTDKRFCFILVTHRQRQSSPGIQQYPGYTPPNPSLSP